jgi:serine/threonine protein kinase
VQEIKKVFSSKKERAELLQELNTAIAVPAHPNIVRYMRGWQEKRKLHIQMELCAAGSLDALLKRGELCLDEHNLPEPLLWLILRFGTQVLCTASVPRC